MFQMWRWVTVWNQQEFMAQNGCQIFVKMVGTFQCRAFRECP